MPATLDTKPPTTQNNIPPEDVDLGEEKKGKIIADFLDGSTEVFDQAKTQTVLPIQVGQCAKIDFHGQELKLKNLLSLEVVSPEGI